jgi:hypothetical protein
MYLTTPEILHPEVFSDGMVLPRPSTAFKVNMIRLLQQFLGASNMPSAAISVSSCFRDAIVLLA